MSDGEWVAEMGGCAAGRAHLLGKSGSLSWIQPDITYARLVWEFGGGEVGRDSRLDGSSALRQ